MLYNLLFIFWSAARVWTEYLPLLQQYPKDTAVLHHRLECFNLTARAQSWAKYSLNLYLGLKDFAGKWEPVFLFTLLWLLADWASLERVLAQLLANLWCCHARKTAPFDGLRSSFYAGLVASWNECRKRAFWYLCAQDLQSLWLFRSVARRKQAKRTHNKSNCLLKEVVTVSPMKSTLLVPIAAAVHWAHRTNQIANRSCLTKEVSIVVSPHGFRQKPKTMKSSR